MKKKLLLYLSKLSYSGNMPLSATLAWLTASKSYLFDNYFDSYHSGIHFPGGDVRNLELGDQMGGTVACDRHFEQFYFMHLNFDVSIITFGETLYYSSIKNLNIPIVAHSEQINNIYKKTFQFFGVPIPQNIVMIGSGFDETLTGIDAYFYPEVYYRQAVGVHDSITEVELADLYQDGGKIYCLFVNQYVITKLKKKGYDVELLDHYKKDDNYLTITKRIAQRWKNKTKGWILGDPLLVTCWLPKACEENLIAIYSIPQEKIISELGDLISQKGNVVYGRQTNDKDFFKLSELNQCFQVIDPCRPPFQSVRHVDYSWYTNQEEGLFYPEYSDEDLRQFAHENKILISLMFWNGMIREIVNFYNLMDLIALTGLKCGLVLTAQSYEYMMHSPLELLLISLEQGGVYPYVEPVLGSCGVGVAIESYITQDRLREDLNDSLTRIQKKVKNKNLLPKGWWATMDVDLHKLSLWKKPKPINFRRYPPYMQIRFDPKYIEHDDNTESESRNRQSSGIQHFIDRMRGIVRKTGLSKYFDPYRPYEFFGPGSIKEDLINSVKSTGLEYMFTKAGFNSHPDVKYFDEDFIVLNYTTGQWDGWTPFETINDVSDLRKSERILHKRKKPGWIVGTIDTCLWTFGGEFWKRSKKLYDIAQFCANGGRSKKLINVKPFTVARYARLIAENV